MEFYIVDDDISIIRILENIIINQKLGVTIGTSQESKKALKEIIEERPDIVLIDLLLPKIDGINIIKKIREIDENVSFIMISEVFTKDMVSKAYSAGIEYYINKPINVIEATSIIKKVKEKRKNIQLINSYKNIRKINSNSNEEKKEIKLDLIIKKLNKVGATGKGKIDLANIIEYIIKNGNNNYFYNNNMYHYYEYLSKYYKKKYNNNVKAKTIKQRIRRSVIDSLESISGLGLEDYFNSTFEKYASTLFKFAEVRKEMEYLKGISEKPGKIDIKRYIGGIINDLDKF